ncbi:MAG: nucleotide exchange factor GrpE [Bacteroidales bacterium]|nr:nucleotide exchange factor GrpE [Bacteroidales bacterium]
MSHKNKKKMTSEEVIDEEKNNVAETEEAAAKEKESAEESAEEAMQKAVDELKAALDTQKEAVEAQKKEYHYLMAEFDNFRRRSAQEKLELVDTAAKGVIKDLLPVVDDFERALEALSKAEGSEAAKEGTELIYKKLVSTLKSKGLEEIEAVGKEFDTDEHEAVAQIPAPEEKLKGKVVEVVQKGYKLGGKVIRFAKVVIGI